SSFQLDTTERFRPAVAVVLNVTPDHLDRHHTLEAYVAAKAKILANQRPEDCAVLNEADDWYERFRGEARGRVLAFRATGVPSREGPRPRAARPGGASARARRRADRRGGGAARVGAARRPGRAPRGEHRGRGTPRRRARAPGRRGAARAGLLEPRPVRELR